MDEELKHVSSLSGASILLNTISVEGEASFTLRRGKRILCYELCIKFNWEVRDAYGSALGAKGKGSISELTQEDEVPPVSIEVSTTFSGGKEAKAAGEWMRRQGASKIGSCLVGPRLSAAVLASEEARCNTEQDAKRRAEERKKAEAARTVTSDHRAQLAANQKASEEARRVKPVEGGVQGSVWNANAWHWEEKPMTSWAHSWLRSKLDSLTIELLAGMAMSTLMDIKVS